LYVRAVVLHHATHAPLPKELPIQAVIEVIGPKGDSVASGVVAVEEGVLGFSWQVPDEQAGGEYKAKVTFPYHGPQRRPRRHFDIRAYRAPRLKTQIKFLRDGYGPSDEVVTTLHVERPRGAYRPERMSRPWRESNDRRNVSWPRTMDLEGNCTARFRLPARWLAGKERWPWSSKTRRGRNGHEVDPDLAANGRCDPLSRGRRTGCGFANRIYLEAFTPARKPADSPGRDRRSGARR